MTKPDRFSLLPKAAHVQECDARNDDMAIFNRVHKLKPLVLTATCNL